MPLHQSLPLLVSTASLLIAILALLNSRRARVDSKKDGLFRLKLEAQVCVREVEIEWQEILNELERDEVELYRNLPNPAPQETKDAFAGWKAHIRSSLANAKDLRESYEKNFDGQPEESVRYLLRACKSNRMSLASSKLEMKKKLQHLRSGIRPISNDRQ